MTWPAPGTASRPCIPPDAHTTVPTTSTPGRPVETGAHPSTIGLIVTPEIAICCDHDPKPRRS
jgi:hypothetical protein